MRYFQGVLAADGLQDLIFLSLKTFYGVQFLLVVSNLQFQAFSPLNAGLSCKLVHKNKRTVSMKSSYFF